MAKAKVNRQPCSVTGCETSVLARGYCQKHYYRVTGHGSTDLHPRFTARSCSVAECAGKATRKSLCAKHYSRMCAHGTTADPAPFVRATCAVDGCSRGVKGKSQYCLLHMERVRKHGDPSIGKAEAKSLAAVMGACVQCGSQIQRNTNDHVYCSDLCGQRNRAGRSDSATCRVCQAAFKTADGALHCSTACVRASRRRQHQAAKARVRRTEQGRARLVAINSAYAARHKDRVNAAVRHKRRTDPTFRMAAWVRLTLAKVLERTNTRKSARSEEIVGYSGAQLRQHLERQFLTGMVWDNYGKWHVDHIVSIATFLRRGLADPMAINALPNLRPMWAKDNMRKGDKVVSLL